MLTGKPSSSTQTNPQSQIELKAPISSDQVSTVGSRTNTVRAAGIVSIAVMGSRILGLIREQMIAYLFGSTAVTDAFYAAFQIPNLMRDLFGEGILSKAFVITFTSTAVEDSEEAAWDLANRVFSGIAVLLVIITLVGILAAPYLINLIYLGQGFNLALEPNKHFGFASKRQLTIFLTRMMFPFLLLVSLAAIAMGLLNSKGRFGIPAAASSFFNLSTILIGITGFFLFPKIGWHPVTGLALGVLVGGGLQFLVQIPSMWQVGFRFRPVFNFVDARVRQVIGLVIPAILGVAAVQINVMVNGMFASVGENWLSWIKWSFRLMHLPIGVFGVAISTVSLPNFARHLAEGRIDLFRQSYRKSLELVLLLTIPASAGLMVLAEPICRLIYGIGKNADHTTPIATALFFYAFGLCAYSALKITTDGFYAHNDTKTPVWVSLLSVVINIILNYVFILRLGLDHRSLAISTASTITLNFLLLLWLLNRRVGGLGLRSLPSLVLRLLLAATVMGLVCIWSNHWIESLIGIEGLTPRLIGVFVPIGLGLVILLIICRLLRIEALDDLLQVLRRR